MAWILVVDDEPRTAHLVARTLDRNGFLVDVVNSGGEALSALSRKAYGLVLLDLLMPGVDGYQVLRQMVTTDAEHKVVVVSGVTDVESKVRCLRLGAVDYLPKPFALAELVARVNLRLSEHSAPPAERWLGVGGARLDLQRRSLQIESRDIPLSQREFVLLGHLMRHAGEVCSREELLADVWGYPYDCGSNVVDVCVRRLRSKTQSGLIETVRNVGYSFVAG